MKLAHSSHHTSASGALAASTAGASNPLGATITADGVNFSVFSKHATGIDLLLFDRVDDARPARVVHLDPAAHRSYHYWHVFVPGLKAGQVYGFRAHGPSDPSKGHRVHSGHVLLDPHGRAVVVPVGYNRTAAHDRGDNAGTAMQSVVVHPSADDRGSDTPL